MANGTVKWYNKEKGYGFITTPDGLDVFVHYSQINMEGFKFLQDGQDVELDIIEGQKGLLANNVNLLTM